MPLRPGAPRRRADLPDAIPVFPLAGALLLPRGRLPLNIFEPRYLNMVDDALAGARLIGMVQPRSAQEGAHTPPVFDVGCAGRITAFSESGDGRYLITLTGVSRFRIRTEMQTGAPYRIAQAGWDAFSDDLSLEPKPLFHARDRLLNVLRAYLRAQGLEADWDSIEEADGETLVNSLSMICPFSPQEKQALLEAQGLCARADCLTALMEMALAAGGDGDGGEGGALQ